MKIKEKVAHGEVGHFCEGGCAGYAKGGRIPEQRMEAIARNREEMGLPATEGGAGVLMDQIPGIGLIKTLSDSGDIKGRLSNPELLHTKVGKGLETNLQHGAPWDKFGQGADVQMLAEGGAVKAPEDDSSGIMNMLRNYAMEHKGLGTVDDEDAKIAQNIDTSTDTIHGYAKGGQVEAAEKSDPGEIPEDIREFVEMQHKARQESRPDEGWRLKPKEKGENIAPYKRDEEEAQALPENEMPHFDEGGQVDDPNKDLQDLAPQGSGMIAPAPAAAQPPEPAPIAPAPVQPATPPVKPVAPAAPASPALTDQDFMNRANKMLGLNPDEQAGFMKLLGGNAQKAQLGAGIAGIGDAIASGGTLGKVNPGALKASEGLIDNRTNQGLQGLQTIRENQGKALDVADKLESRDPASPLSKWAQKAYGPVGKKIGLDLNNASAALIGDVTGKGVEALNTEYQNQLKTMGLDLQKKQVEATIGNQKAERDIAREGHQADAAKTLADRGILKTLANAIPGTAGHNATKILEKQAAGSSGPVSVNSKVEYDALPSGTHYVDSFGTEKVKK